MAQRSCLELEFKGGSNSLQYCSYRQGVVGLKSMLCKGLGYCAIDIFQQLSVIKIPFQRTLPLLDDLDELSQDGHIWSAILLVQDDGLESWVVGIRGKTDFLVVPGPIR